MVWIELGLYGVIGVVFLVILVRNLRRWTRGGGNASDLFRASTAVVEVAVDEDAAGALCKRALLEVNETRTTRRFKRGRLRVLSHLDKKNPGGLSVNFELKPLEPARTRILVSLYPMRGSINLTITRQRKALAERIGTWLADQGHGRVVEQGWGKLGG
jgi:hypothetical protein